MDKKIIEIVKEIDKINWLQYREAYSGTGEKIAVYLKDLLCGNDSAKLEAIKMLHASVCHQDIAVEAAALPSYDFLMYALLNFDDRIKTELLWMLSAFAMCVSEDVDTIKADYPIDLASEIILDNIRLREKFMANVEVFKGFSSHPNKDIAHFSREICDYIAGE